MQPLTINAEFSSDSWGLARIIRRNAPYNVERPRFPITTFYEALRDGTGVDIYSIDSGIDTTHAETLGRVTNVYDYFGTGGVHNGDDLGHGTGAASAMAGSTCGPARGALLWSFKIYSSAGTASLASIQASLTEALAHYNSRAGLNRPAVCSANFSINSSAIEPHINAMIDAGMVIVTGPHNYGTNLSTSGFRPSIMTDVIAVGGIGPCDLPYYLGIATDSTGAPQIGTGFGSQIALLGPAQNLRIANASVLGGGYRVHSGNSYSTPFATGVVACMLQGHNRLTSRAQVQAVRAKLIANATVGKFRPAFGYSPLPDKILYMDPYISFETFP